ncbi:hypothetical protein A9Q81_18255 [Gammaproteobacteria bacterium 42_54_T18]|nr:hypothetical protein A9Q81_18255 [Gammaproteobacteria bacterium 42_54_T18]
MGLGLRTALFILLMSLTGNTAALIKIDSNSQKIVVGESITYLADISGNLHLEDILSDEHQQKFLPSTKKSLNFGFTDTTYWIKIDIAFDSKLAQSTHWIMEVSYPLLDDITFYRQENQGYEKYVAGDTIPFSERAIEYPNPVFHITNESGESVTHYLRINSSSSLQIPITIWSSDSFAENTGEKLLVLGAFYGIMFVMILYNFFIFTSIRNDAYLYYILYISCFTLFLASFNGLSFQYLWPESPRWGNIAVPFFISVSGFGATQFTRRFLNTPHTTPILDKVLLGILVLSLTSIITSFTMPYQIAIRAAVLVALSFGITVLITGTACLLKGLRIARFFLLAWVTLLFGIIIHALLSLGFLPTNTLTLHADQMGSVIEVVLLSFALADRINSLRIEKDIFQREAMSVLKRSNKVKDEFLSTISHELRTPMNGIMNAMQLTRHTQLNEEQNGLVHIASQSSGNMLTLIDNILGFTEAQAGSLHLREEPFIIRELLKDLDTRFQTTCNDKGITFKTNVTPEVPDYLLGNDEKLQKLIGYFLDNSVKFTESGIIELNISIKEGANTEKYQWVQFDVIDTGIGIKEEDKQNIFEVFQQADGAFSRRYGGLGIGLSIAKQVNTLMERTINFESQIGKGTHVTLTIPMLETSHLPHPITTDTDLIPENTRILIVEDNQTILKKIIEAQGYQAQIAENGQVALDIIDEYSPHVILMDCQMPIMDGFTATQKIRLLEKPLCDTPIIAVTANVMAGNKQRCLEAGMDDYLKKPTNKDVLKTRIKQWLSYRKDNDTKERAA